MFSKHTFQFIFIVSFMSSMVFGNRADHNESDDILIITHFNELFILKFALMLLGLQKMDRRRIPMTCAGTVC